MNLFELKPHPYSKIFPDMDGDEFSGLVASVKKLGRIRNRILVYQNQILDGRHRLKACRIAKVEPRYVEFQGTDAEALEAVWDLNYNRRNQSASQRSVAFAQYCNFADTGKPAKGGHVTSLEEAAAKVNVSEKTMQRAKKVVKHGTKKQIESVKQGEKTVSEVASEIAQGDDAPHSTDAVDDLGYAIPEAAQEYWNRKEEAKEILAQIQSVKRRIKALDPKDPMWAEVNLNGVLGELSSVINRFGAAVPAYVCVYCQGLHPAKCTTCKGRGVVSEYMWRMIPEELRKLRESQCK